MQVLIPNLKVGENEMVESFTALGFSLFVALPDPSTCLTTRTSPLPFRYNFLQSNYSLWRLGSSKPIGSPSMYSEKFTPDPTEEITQ